MYTLCTTRAAGGFMLGRIRVTGKLVAGLTTLLVLCAVPTVAAVPALASGPTTGATYVARGDSYSSGEGVDPRRHGRFLDSLGYKVAGGRGERFPASPANSRDSRRDHRS